MVERIVKCRLRASFAHTGRIPRDLKTWWQVSLRVFPASFIMFDT